MVLRMSVEVEMPIRDSRIAGSDFDDCQKSREHTAGQVEEENSIVIWTENKDIVALDLER